jgi:hypothetical protein
MAEDRVRPGADDIYERVKRDAHEELERPVPALAMSALFAGATLGFSARPWLIEAGEHVTRAGGG